MSHTKVTVWRYMTVILIAFTTLWIAPSTRAATSVTFVPGTAVIELAVQDAVSATLQDASADTYGAQIFAVTAVQGTAAWRLVSIAGFAQLSTASWSLEDAVWVGLVLVVRNADGAWASALKGSAYFADLMARVPIAEFDESMRAGLLPSRHPLAADATTYRFPWQPGTRMYYGSLGVHPGDYAWLVGAYKAVDFLSDGDTAAGHAPNRLLAAASGTIDYVCPGAYNTAIRIGNVMYLHLIANPTLIVGHSFKQGEFIGQLKTGTFSDNCGWASQGDAWFHVHWSFPDTGTFIAGGWTLTFADQIWRRDAASVAKMSWMLSDLPKTVYLPLITIRIQ